MQSHNHILKLLLLTLVPFSLLFLSIFILFCFCKRLKPSIEDPQSHNDHYKSDPESEFGEELQPRSEEQLIRFQGGESLEISDILDAPGEVIGKSSYGTLYKASLIRGNYKVLLRFLRPACSGTAREVIPFVHVIGLIRHPNLVPLRAFYMGPRGEKLLVHPFYASGNLAQFIRGGSNEHRKWDVIYKIAYDIVKGLDHLHTGLHKPIIHGNLSSKNVLLDRTHHPYVSDHGLHLLLNRTAAQDMLDTSAAQGYKAPELIKMKDVSESTDMYSLGVILLELLTGKEPINEKATGSRDFHLPDAVRSAVIDHRIKDLCHPQVLVNEEKVLKMVQLAMACCSPSPSLRPHIKEVLRKLEDVRN